MLIQIYLSRYRGGQRNETRSEARGGMKKPATGAFTSKIRKGPGLVIIPPRTPNLAGAWEFLDFTI
ncbi:hypothetical protein [Mucilaginibacter phyllosphaerae]